MITIACWKWKRIATGHQLPHVVEYSDQHVLAMQEMLCRHVTVPYRFVCITDEPVHGVQCIPLWPTYDAGGCYHRLKVFDADFDLLGERFAWIDLDVVITGNIDHLLTMEADFVIHRYAYNNCPDQHYNGAFVMMRRGARQQVWNCFNPKKSPAKMVQLNQLRRLVGSDQAWIAHCLGPNESTIGPEHGVYEAGAIKKVGLPENACMVFFSGAQDPTTSDLEWVSKHYPKHGYTVTRLKNDTLATL